MFWLHRCGWAITTVFPLLAFHLIGWLSWDGPYAPFFVGNSTNHPSDAEFPIVRTGFGCGHVAPEGHSIVKSCLAGSRPSLSSATSYPAATGLGRATGNAPWKLATGPDGRLTL